MFGGPDVADTIACRDETQPALEYTIAAIYLDNTSDANLQATLRLGMLEIITGEFVEQLRREIGATEEFSAAGLSVGASTERGVDLIQQGATRLAPFLASALPMMAETASKSTSVDKEPAFSAEEEVW